MNILHIAIKKQTSCETISLRTACLLAYSEKFSFKFDSDCICKSLFEDSSYILFFALLDSVLAKLSNRFKTFVDNTINSSDKYEMQCDGAHSKMSMSKKGANIDNNHLVTASLMLLEI